MFKVTLEEVKKYSYGKKNWGCVKVGPRNYPRIYCAWGVVQKNDVGFSKVFGGGAELQCSRIL